MILGKDAMDMKITEALTEEPAKPTMQTLHYNRLMFVPEISSEYRIFATDTKPIVAIHHHLL